MANENLKIISLEAEAVKKIKVVNLQFTEKGLTIIGGNNKNGKTSVLDSIAFLLGGDSNRPSDLKNKDSDSNPYIRAELSNGLIVERKGKNSSLKITDPSGEKSGQSLLNSFVSEFSLNIGAFLNAEGPKKKKLILRALGDEEKLLNLEAAEKKETSEREFVNRELKRLQGAFDSAAQFPNAPKEVVSIESIEDELKNAVSANQNNNEKRVYLDSCQEMTRRMTKRIEEIDSEIEKLIVEKNDVKGKMKIQNEEIEELQFDVDCLNDIPTAPIQEKFSKFSELNEQVSANEKKEELRIELRKKEKESADLDEKIKSIRSDKTKIVDTSKTKLDGLEWDGDELVFNGQKWDGMSGAEQMIVSSVIARALTPNAGFVLVDKLEQMDLNTLDAFSQWLKENDLQAIGTRVSTGEECSFILEEGEVKK